MPRLLSSPRLFMLLPVGSLSFALAGCTTLDAAPPATTATQASSVQGADVSEFFDNYDNAELSLSPEGKAYRGIRDGDYGSWDNVSDEAAIAREKLQQATAAAMRTSFDPANLSTDDALSVELFDAQAKRSARLFAFRDHRYIFDQMNGAQSELPAFLINIHSIADAAQANNYIERMRGMAPVLDQLSAKSAARAAAGMNPPKWVFAYVISDVDNLTGGGKGTGLEGNALIDDFRAKVGKLDITPDAKAALIASAIDAWQTAAKPAYLRLRAEMVRQQAAAPTEDGVWRMPDGAAYYQALLANYTTTDMTPAQIHQLGLEQVARIHGEMEAIKAQVGFEGTLNEFFDHVRSSPQFYHTSREAYLAEVDQRVKAMEVKLPTYFGILPKAPLSVKAVEAFREQSAGKAFYSSPAPDGSRPGTYYVNLYNLRDMPKTELEALVYHEGVPGHHLQLAIQTEMKDMPAFRRFGGFTAYTEGWGLYAEELAKDMGFYTDPYSDFGRLGMELWRAARLVVDTGIHDKRWTREQAIAYLKANTPNPEGDIEKAIERYIVFPGQATAYMIGKLKIMDMRTKAQAALGDRFDYRSFHDAVLRSGPLPLDIFERRMTVWIETQKSLLPT